MKRATESQPLLTLEIHSLDKTTVGSTKNSDPALFRIRPSLLTAIQADNGGIEGPHPLSAAPSMQIGPPFYGTDVKVRLTKSSDELGTLGRH